MNFRFNTVRLACVVSMGFLCAAAGAATLTPATYDAARDQLKSTYKVERDGCDKLMTGNAKDICVESVKGQEKVAMAHLQFQRTGDVKDMNKLSEARYDARYEIAKEVCDDQTGNAKQVCVATAKSEFKKAKADMKMNKEVAEARNDAEKTKDKADFKVAAERCDAATGNTKDSCLASARARFGQ